MAAATAAEPAAKKPRTDNEAAIALARETGVPSAETMAEPWRTALKAEFTKPYFVKLMAFLTEQRSLKVQVFPPAEDVYSWSRFCTPEQVKVVILGQDPYHDDGQAHGLCFSVKPGVKPPPSLANMYKELATDIDGFKPPAHGYLAPWAEQGVLLLNAVLTVKAHTANAHAGLGWEQFTDAVIDHVNKHGNNCVFILWGGYAQKKGKRIDTKKHCVLNGPHPSPLSCHRGFFGCKHFSLANKYLTEKGRQPIDWKLK